MPSSTTDIYAPPKLLNAVEEARLYRRLHTAILKTTLRELFATSRLRGFAGRLYEHGHLGSTFLYHAGGAFLSTEGSRSVYAGNGREGIQYFLCIAHGDALFLERHFDLWRNLSVTGKSVFS